MKSCYLLKEVTFDSGLFDDCCNCAYVMTMSNSTRDFKTQLFTHKPHSKVIVQINSGYKNCYKLGITKPYQDLVHSLRNVFIDAINKKYNRILVFEDDFIMDKDKYTLEDIKEINKFVIKNNPHVYHLGSLFHFSLSIKKKHNKLIFSDMAHAIIYNKEYMIRFIQDYHKILSKNKHIDTYWHSSLTKKYNFRKWSYHKPIVFQTFPMTENKKEWANNVSIMNKLHKHLHLDTSHKNYTKVYKFCLYIPLMILLLTLFIILIILTLKTS